MRSLRALSAVCFFALSLFLGSACSRDDNEVLLQEFPIEAREDVIARGMVAFDEKGSSSEGGSLRANAVKTRTVRLFEVEDIEVEDARLIYRARLRTAGVDGRAYLEMWCRIPGQGEFFSRAIDSALDGSNDWTTQETPFFLEKGQKPDLIKLNLVIEGSGSVWIDDIQLLSAPRS